MKTSLHYDLFLFSEMISLSSIVANDIIAPFIEFVCNFYHDTESIGCQIELISTLMLSRNDSLVMSADRTEDQAIINFINVIPGVYQLVGFDVHCNGTASQVIEISKLTVLVDHTAVSESFRRTIRDYTTVSESSRPTTRISPSHRLSDVVYISALGKKKI